MTGKQGETIAERLRTPVQFLKGVGPRVAPLLRRLRLRTAADVLFHFPRAYEDLTQVTPVELLDGTRAVCVQATVEEAELRELGNGRSVLAVLLRSGTTPLRAVWFNQPYMRQKVLPARRVMLFGTPKKRGLCWEFSHPRVVQLDASPKDSPLLDPPRDGGSPPEGRDRAAAEMLPVYPSTEGLTQAKLRQVARDVVLDYADLIEDVFAADYLHEHNLLPVRDALRCIHLPSGQQDVDRARRRFVYQELLVLQLALAMRRWKLRQSHDAPPLPATAKIDARIRRLFPFGLTGDQCQAIQEIASDMGRSVPMNRLLQGEVGSGKTAVAEYAMLLAVAHGCQSVLMAPTEVLARQHLQTLSEDLRQSRVRMDLLTGSLTARQREDLHRRVRAGEVDLVIGTQALLHEQLSFPRLGLVVIDEQHKFGVQQRAALRSVAVDPHYLIMTATPIPRTLTMSLFGDLDVSTIRQPPPGRQPVHTYLATHEQREQWWEFYRGKLREGRQGYVITPRVEEGEKDLASVEAVFEQLANGPLEAFRVDVIHGRMSPAEKEAAMDAFRGQDTQVLVATSVIEVGVNVPNATVMTIESGESFGLAQLHQLRGRVRRGKFPGYVAVFASPGNAEAVQRLEAFARSTDGFELAEIDFSLRGPGDLLGIRQHGMPPLRIADLQRDYGILAEARRDAALLLEDAGLLQGLRPGQDQTMLPSEPDPRGAESNPGPPPRFFRPEFARLRRQVLQRYGKVLDLADVG